MKYFKGFKQYKENTDGWNDNCYNGKQGLKKLGGEAIIPAESASQAVKFFYCVWDTKRYFSKDDKVYDQNEKETWSKGVDVINLDDCTIFVEEVEKDNTDDYKHDDEDMPLNDEDIPLNDEDIPLDNANYILDFLNDKEAVNNYFWAVDTSNQQIVGAGYIDSEDDKQGSFTHGINADDNKIGTVVDFITCDYLIVPCNENEYDFVSAGLSTSDEKYNQEDNN